jgi:hypothetical protein
LPNRWRKAIALHFKYCNYGQIHHVLCVTPAMAARLTDHLWGIEEVVPLID